MLARLGLTVHGLNTPGHFLAGVELEGSIMIVDPASFGRVMTPREVIQLVVSASGKSEIPQEQPLPVADTREWLRRVLRNLMSVFGNRNQPTEFAAMVELKGLLE